MFARRRVGVEAPESEPETEARRCSGSGVWDEVGGSVVPGKMLARGLGSQTMGEEKGLPPKEVRSGGGGCVGEDELAPWSGDCARDGTELTRRITPAAPAP